VVPFWVLPKDCGNVVNFAFQASVKNFAVVNSDVSQHAACEASACIVSLADHLQDFIPVTFDFGPHGRETVRQAGTVNDSDHLTDLLLQLLAGAYRDYAEEDDHLRASFHSS
jgi:hypothetical protein